MLVWDDLRYFLAVHRHHTLATAGVALGVDPTTVGRRLVALEKRMGARLFDRLREGYRTTSAGQELVPHAERMEAEALAAERELSGADRRLTGTVRLSTTELLGTRFIAPLLTRFHERHPGLLLELQCTHRRQDLSRREADVALRLARPREEDVVARHIASLELALYASRAYLERYGEPAAPESSLRGHRALLFIDSPAAQAESGWLEQRLDGAHVVLRSDSVSTLYAACASGAGIALLPRQVAEADPGLRRLPTRSAPEPRPIWSAVHRDLARSPRVRAVVDFLAEALDETGA